MGQRWVPQCFLLCRWPGQWAKFWTVLIGKAPSPPGSLRCVWSVLSKGRKPARLKPHMWCWLLPPKELSIGILHAACFFSLCSWKPLQSPTTGSFFSPENKQTPIWMPVSFCAHNLVNQTKHTGSLLPVSHPPLGCRGRPRNQQSSSTVTLKF